MQVQRKKVLIRVMTTTMAFYQSLTNLKSLYVEYYGLEVFLKYLKSLAIYPEDLTNLVPFS